MENPLLQPVPDDVLERIHEFARDFAYGVSKGVWGTQAFFTNQPNGKTNVEFFNFTNHEFHNHWKKKWEDFLFGADLLITFGYINKNRNDNLYILTEKAFTLLERPLATPSVFVSYRRMQSSTFALAIEARLKLVDSDIQVFIDKDIPIGDDWENILKEKIQSCRYFILLLGKETLQSTNVQDEIEWAKEANCRIISLLHPGYTFDDDRGKSDRIDKIIDFLSPIQCISIGSESAMEYDTGVRTLLNTLGYSTL